MATIDLNQLPYFDDFDENKNFQRILFKPGVAVQARELTQMQTILQNQIERMGRHIFEDGTIVLGGAFDPQDPVSYVRVADSSSTFKTDILNKELTGSTTGLKAYVVHAETDTAQTDTTILYVQYSNSSNTASVFAAGETLTNSVSNVVTRNTNTTGTGSIFGLGEGVVFAKGYFIRFDSQKIALDQFGTNPSKRVYFKLDFSLVDSNVDGSILDNAQGFNNYNAPGADRLRATCTLVTSDLDTQLSDEEYVVLLEIENGEIKVKNERTDYARISEELAKRTFDESGDYVVYGLDVFTRDHLDDGTNEGRYTEAEGGDANLFVIGVEAGTAYVKGYEVVNHTTRYITAPKSTEFVNVDNQISYVRSGNYVNVNEITGMPDPDEGELVNLYDSAESRVSNNTIYSAAATGNKIGEARLNSILMEDGQLGQANAQMRMYISNVEMNSNANFGQVRSIGNANFFSDVVLTSNNAVINDLEGDTKLYFAGELAIRDLKDENGNYDTSFTFYREKTGTISSSGTLTITISTTDESMPYGTGSLGSLAKDTIFLNVTANTTISLSGNVDITTGNTTVTGSGTTFTSLNAGDRLSIDSTTYIISSITNNTELELTEAASSTYTGTFDKLYLDGDYIDLDSKGSDAGAVRTVTATTSSLTFNLQETFGTTVPCKVVHKAARNSAEPAIKRRRSNRIVLIDGSSAANLDIIPLGFSDIYQVRQIRKSSSPFSLLSDGTDVTNQFTVYNGQTLTTYENGYIVPNSASAVSNTDYLLVELDYFEPDFTTGVGYFSVDSYPIDDTTTSNTTIQTADIPVFIYEEIGYNLRNFIDTRAIKSNTAADATTIGTATTNPSFSTTYDKDSNGLRTIVPGTNITYDYSYYLARRDVFVVDQNGAFSVVSGKPAINPAIPRVSSDYMKIAQVYIPPYPSITSTTQRVTGRYGNGITTQKVTYARHTQREIGNIKTRVKNLEYYNLINALEKETLDLNIVDDNGLTRFKNGVFVDAFADHSLGDINNDDYKCANDDYEKSMRPRYKSEVLKARYDTGTNIFKNTDFITLPYTETSFIRRDAVTTSRNVEFSSYRFVGNLSIFPEVDNWVDSQTVDKVFRVETGVETIGKALIDSGVLETEWNAWKKISSRLTGRGSTSINETNRKVTTSVSSSGDTYVALDLERKPGNRNKPIDSNPGDVGTYTSQRDAAQALRNAGFKRGWIEQTGGTTFKSGYVEYTSRSTYDVQETLQRGRFATTYNVSDYEVDLGDFVTDVSLVPYIRPQIIRLYAQGVKANTLYNVFFDNEKMNDYVTPQPLAASNTNYNDLSSLGEEGDPLYSNENGELVAYLRLPESGKRFRTGSKEIVVTDNPTNTFEFATSYANNTFVSSGLNVQKQGTILSTRNAKINRYWDTESKTRTRTVTKTSRRREYFNAEEEAPSTFIPTGPSCIAYSFYVDEPDENIGVFLSSIDVFIQAMHPTLGVWFEIREMLADGITRNQVPGSEVWMKRNDSRIVISDDATEATNVNFKTPIFLYNKTQYAFIVHTEGLNPDTYFWVSKIGQTDLLTGLPHTYRGQSGTLFTTNNNLNWDPVPDTDLKVVFNRAVFNTDTAGVATFVNEDREYIVTDATIPADFFRRGEPVRGSDKLTLTLNGGTDTVAANDVIRDTVTGAEATVLDVDGVDIYTDGHGFIYSLDANNVVILDGANTDIEKDIDFTIATVDFGMAVVADYHTANGTLILESSNGKFFAGSKVISVLPDRFIDVANTPTEAVEISGEFNRAPSPYLPFIEETEYLTGNSDVQSTAVSNAVFKLPFGQEPGSSGTFPEFTIGSFYRFEYSHTSAAASFIEPDVSTTTDWTLRCVTNTTEDTPIDIIPSVENDFNVVKNILSRSEEISLLNGEKSFKMSVTLNSDNPYLSPIVDQSLSSFVAVDNILNANTTGETDASGGSLDSKYISTVITLNPDDPAEDLNVTLAEYRPLTTEVEVYARFRHPFDAESIRDKDWIELTATKSRYSSTDDKNNFIDYFYELPTSVQTGDFGEYQYTTDAGTFIGFFQFQIKVGFVGENKAVYPKIGELRAIALQV